MSTILITGIGGPTPRSIARSIRKNFPDVRIVGVDMNLKAIGFFMQGLLDAYYQSPCVDHPDYWFFIKRLIDKEKIDMAFVQPEKEVIEWGGYYDQNGDYPCPVLIPPKTLALSLMDKAIMAELLSGSGYIPKTIKVTQNDPKFEEVEREIGFPCWIRATRGSGGLGSLKLMDISSYRSWLFINNEIDEFTVSEFLTGRHIANQMLYYDDEYIKGASLECAEYVMASIAPSKVTGNTSFGRFINEDSCLEFCNECVRYLCEKTNQRAHGVLSFDLKEDKEGNPKVTEINIRHMAYTGIMSDVGFDLIADTMKILQTGNADCIKKNPYFHYEKPYIFLRDVDIEPIILEGEHQLVVGAV